MVHENEQACIIVCLGAYMRSVFVVDKYIGCISIVGSGLEILLISVSLLFDSGSHECIVSLLLHACNYIQTQC